MSEHEHIMKVVSGEASEEVRKQFFASMDKDPDLRANYESLTAGWESATDAMIYRGLDEDAAWDRQKNTLSEVNADDKAIGSIGVIKWAASIVVALLAGYWLINAQNQSIETSVAENRQLRLLDGSIVTVNENTTVSYELNEERREITLAGEAYFQVARDEDRPFIVATEQAVIKVLGTSFDVVSDESSTVVVVDEGLVEFGNEEGIIKLKKGESGMISMAERPKLTKEDANHHSWFSRSLVFEDVPLTKVLKDLERTYYLQFELETRGEDRCRLTANFNDEELEDVIAAISLIFDIDFVKIDDFTYKVTQYGCQ